MAPHDKTTVPFSAAQGMIDAIWAEMGLRYPPRAERIPRHTRRVIATGDRLSLRLPETMPSWVVLHEIAHAMTSTHDGGSDGHGPVFVGIYVGLLVRYMRLGEDSLLASLLTHEIQVQRDARPAFWDRAPT